MLGRQQSESGSDEGPDKREHSAEVITDGAPLPRIAGYELKRQIGRGGSATVYLAREVKHDRLVALKVLHQALAASLQAERFLREISIIAKLSHPNILPLLDSGSVGGQLYYVTPYVEGESLRRRLERERQLPADTAARLAVEVAGALDYAHRQGLVHRDIKPENILLADGHALVADFGIARALSLAGDDRLTAIGIAVGTPRYMSPEQADGRKLDGRSDVYSLGCVLFELLAGEVPFEGETAQEIVALHLSAPVPSLRHVRPRIPAHVLQAINVSLAKRPDDRFATASEFATALALSRSPWSLPLPARWPLRRRSGLGIAAIITAVASVLVAQRTRSTPEALPWHLRVLAGAGLARISLDTTRLIVIAADSESARAGTEAGSMLRAALRRWREISVEDEARVAEELDAEKGNVVRRSQRAALALGAGRYIRFGIATAADARIISASIHDTRTNGLLATREIRVPANQPIAIRAVQVLADSLLLRTIVPSERVGENAGTTSLQARLNYLLGHRALASGKLAVAESLFTAASAIDEDYAQAVLWLANLRSWFDVADRPWRQLPGRAGARRRDLEPTDSILLDAVAALSNRDFVTACPLWRTLTARSPTDFAAWYGLGNCLRRDRTVVRDMNVPNGWRFQSSRHEAVLAFEHAFRLRPAMLQGFGGRSLADLQNLMFTSGSYVQTGRSADPLHPPFIGYPVWQGDTLALLALSGASVERGPESEAFAEAVQHQRIRFRDVVSVWKSEFPRSPQAIEAVAVAMEMLGDPAALDTLRRARAFAVDADDRLRIAVSETLMRIKFSLPDDRAGMRAARALADSILRENPPSRTRSPESLGALAGLTGRAALAAAYSRLEGWHATLPPALARTGPALIAYAAFGGPLDTLTALERSLGDAILGLPTSERPMARAAWLTRAAVLAFPEASLHSLPDTGETGLLPGNVIARAAAGDTAGVKRMLAAIAAARRWLRPADIMTDGLLPEAAALARIGERDTAVARLDATLRSLRLTASQDLAFTYRTASLIRATMLRADLARAAGDHASARLWAAAAVEMWSDADQALQDAVKRMRHMSR